MLCTASRIPRSTQPIRPALLGVSPTVILILPAHPCLSYADPCLAAGEFSGRGSSHES